VSEPRHPAPSAGMSEEQSFYEALVRARTVHTSVQPSRPKVAD
jgi:hypothetical protein